MKNNIKLLILTCIACFAFTVNAYAIEKNKQCSGCPKKCVVKIDANEMKKEFKACAKKCGCDAESFENATKEERMECLQGCGCNKIKMEQVETHKARYESMKKDRPECKSCSLVCASINGFHDKMGKFMDCAEECGCVSKDRKPNTGLKKCAKKCGCEVK